MAKGGLIMSLDIHLEDNYCEHCKRGQEVYWSNITHNLAPMAKVLGIYSCLWKAEEAGIKTASQLVMPLGQAIDDMQANPKAFIAYESENGWGTFDGFLKWLQNLEAVCRLYPHAIVRVSV